jgi:hypothetical protein
MEVVEWKRLPMQRMMALLTIGVGFFFEKKKTKKSIARTANDSFVQTDARF